VLVIDRQQAIRLIRKIFSPNGIGSEQIPDGGLNSRRYYFGLYRLRQMIAAARGRIAKEDINPYWQLHKDYVLFQTFLPDNRFDTRVTVIGNRAFAFRRINRKGDFRASGSGNIDYDYERIDSRCVELAFKASEHFSFQAMAYDFLSGPEGAPVICEMSYTFVDRAVYDCPGYVTRHGSFVSGQHWPQDCVIEDLLNSQ
jgi:hypothetical protein